MDKYDVFTDGECANIRILDEKYPGAKFILNSRPLLDWLVSRHKSVQRSRKTVKWIFRKFLPIGGLKNFVTDKLLRNDIVAVKRWIEIRNRYHFYAIDYFKDRPNDFMVSDITDEHCFRKLRKFTGVKIERQIVHKNDDGS